MKNITHYLVLGLLISVPGLILAHVIEISSTDQFNNEIINSKKPAVVKVGATWCPACVRAHNPFSSLSSNYPNVVFADIDYDSNKSLSDKYNVQSFPTFLFFNNGSLVTSIPGFKENQIKNTIDQKLQPSAPTPAIAPAAQAALAPGQNSELASAQPEAQAQGPSCANQAEGFFERAYNAVRDFFASVGQQIRSLFS